MLTPKAKALSDEYNKVSDEMSCIFYENFTEEEIDQFERFLEKILTNLILKEGER